MRGTVYVYQGPGASPLCSDLLVSSLRRCLSPTAHSIQRISPQSIKQGSWRENCAALVLGGGYDMGFVQSLEPEGADMIQRFVLQGGTYIGMCAGAYFACDSIQFEKGTKMEVCGDRALKFYPGQCIGSIIPGFKYNSERGAAALPITLPPGSFSRSRQQQQQRSFQAYVNGAGFFSPHASSTKEKFPNVRAVDVLAEFESLEGRPAAVVRCAVGGKGGVALLSSPHVEFAASELNQEDEYLMKIDKELRCGDAAREAFLKSFLQQGNLIVRASSSL